MINHEICTNDIDGASADETMSDSNTDTKFEVWPVRKGIEMKFARSQLENVQLLTCKKLNLSVKCGKCKNIFEFANLLPTTSKDNDKQAWSACPNCNQMAGLRFRSGWIHQSSNSLGFLDTSNASPVDLRPSEYILTCDSCLNECDSINDNNKIEPKNISNKNCFELILNTRNQINCRNCHARMAVTLMDFSFTKLVPGFKLGETKSSQAQISKALEKVSEAKKKKAGAINSNLVTYDIKFVDLSEEIQKFVLLAYDAEEWDEENYKYQQRYLKLFYKLQEEKQELDKKILNVLFNNINIARMGNEGDVSGVADCLFYLAGLNAKNGFRVTYEYIHIDNSRPDIRN
ncbi:hypothetical protein AYI69_g9260 [Smittium culicis]|uniref:Uncharacterized protein n=1 Tax=Smittium culicis TaxID=133412 RepID=A0A1R1XDU9_9FUNG|nr:hypothetical protein AYI69_g9260 [Smittium culicis]